MSAHHTANKAVDPTTSTQDKEHAGLVENENSRCLFICVSVHQLNYYVASSQCSHTQMHMKGVGAVMLLLFFDFPGTMM
jgi:hypothetical protein